MTQLFSILTTEADTGSGFVQILPIILLAVCGVILVLSFIVGCKKGAKRVSWAGFVWLCAAVAFCLLQGLLVSPIARGMEQTIEELTTGLVGSSQYHVQLASGLSAFLPAFLIALTVILVVMLIYGLLSMHFRPRIKMIPKNADVYVLDEDGVEYDEDFEDYDDYEMYTSRKMPLRLNYETPGFGTRLIGGILSLVNAVMILGTVLALGLFLIYCTSLKDGALAELFAWEIGSFKPLEAYVQFASRYALDIFFIGILIAFMCKGRRTGFIEALRGFMKFVGLALGIYCLIAPFTAAADGASALLYGLTSRCIIAGRSIFGETWYAPLIAKLFAGLLLLIFDIAVFVFLNWVLTKGAEWAVKHRFTRLMDGAFASIIYLFIGILVCLLVWAFWYLLARYGIFNVQELFTAEAPISGGLFNTMGGIIEPLLARLDKALGLA